MLLHGYVAATRSLSVFDLGSVYRGTCTGEDVDEVVVPVHVQMRNFDAEVTKEKDETGAQTQAMDSWDVRRHALWIPADP